MKVTIDFKDPKVEKPTSKTEYEMFLIVTEDCWMSTVTYNRRFDLFNAAGADTLAEAKETAIHPKWWAEIPLELKVRDENN